jgi:prolyl-tRNA editing enzyme YbaK/EbsC (Cys-tRNA(Pro) deacylase)/predicted Fe-S protein YdhL (DUF1289 family)
MLETAARTAQQAADALGVQLGQIAKSIIFKRIADNAAVLVVTSGDRRVDQSKVEAQTGPLARADAAFVKEKTGFSIGGVSPVGHATPCVTLVDEDLFRFETIWAAAGHPHAVFALSPQELSEMVDTIESDVVQAPLVEMPVAARKLLSDRSAAVRSAGSSFISPCVSVCRMDEAAGLCLGCLRSIEEIVVWSQVDDAGRMAIWRGIEARLQGVPA